MVSGDDATMSLPKEDNGSGQRSDLPTEADSSKPVTFKEKLKTPEYRKNVLRTIILGASFTALGFVVGQRGPAFLDIQIITRTDVEQASFFFTSASVGYLVGSVLAGVIYDKLNKSLLFLLMVLGLGLSTIALPWCSIYGMMIAIHFVVSVFAGGVDTAGNAELVRIWGKEGEMAMQFIHFTFAFGAVIGPLATEPFLTPSPEEEMDSTTIRPLSVNTTLSAIANWSYESSSSFDNSSATDLPLTTDVHYAYMISGTFALLVVIPLTVQLFKERSQKRRQNRQDEKTVKQPLPLAMFLFVQITLCVFYYLYCSVEDTFAAYLSTFVVKQLHWSKTDGANISSLFWATFAAGRFSCIFVVRFLNLVKLLILSCMALTISLLAFLLLSQQGAHIGVWVFAALAGASMSAIFPTGFSWMEKELVRVTGRVASSILIASSAGTMVNPILLGYLMQKSTPMWYSYLLFVESVLCLFVFLLLLALSRLYIQHHYQMQEVKELEIVPNLNRSAQTTEKTLV